MLGSLAPRRSAAGVLAALCLALASLVTAATAGAQDAQSFTNVKVIAVGGNAVALATCINEAKAKKQIQQVNQCQNAPIAAGGSVALDGVTVIVQQLDPKTKLPKGAPQTFTNVNLEAKGGDATAVASCANAAEGGEATMVNICTNAPTAVGGTVVLTNVTIAIGKVV